MRDPLLAPLATIAGGILAARYFPLDAREALAPMSERAIVEEDLARLVDQIVITAQPGDHILVMSNGGFGGIHAKLLQRLGQG